MLSLDDEWAKFISSSTQNTYSIPTHETRNSKLPITYEDKSSTTASLTALPSIPRTLTVALPFNGKPDLNAGLDSDPVIFDEDEDNVPQEKEKATPLSNINELFISTKTKVLFLNQPIDINDVFWKIPIEEYWRPVDCVVKKQMKIVSKTPEEHEQFMEKLKSVPYYTETIIKQINNPTARRIKFKDERKITVGISKKDIMNCRGKVKNAFYNCFAIIVRFKYQGEFREIHVKIFNTGKLEIPGVLNAEILDIMRGFVLRILQPHISTPLSFIENSNDDNVLINSNFNCGFYIDREKLFSILRSNKYGLETAYDPCI